MAHILSDTEDVSINKTEIKKELEKLTEVELQRKYKQLAKELKGCRRRVRDRLERKLNDVKSSDMVGLLRRLKTKLNILEDVKKKRIAALYKRQGELRKKIAERKLRETLERGDAKKKQKEENRDGSGNLKTIWSPNNLSIIVSKHIQNASTRTLTETSTAGRGLQRTHSRTKKEDQGRKVSRIAQTDQSVWRPEYLRQTSLSGV